MVKSLGCSIINMYSMGACAVLGINDQDALSEDLENDPFLNSALQRVTCELYYRFGSSLAPLSVGIITSRHYLSERNKNGEQEQTSGDNESPATADCWAESEDQQPQERTSEWYSIIYRYGDARFLAWGWNHFRQ